MNVELKEFIVWNKMLYNRGGAWLSDGVLGGIIGASIIQGTWILVMILLITRWLVGVIDYHFKIVQLENELAIKKQNPYLERKLNGKKK